MSELVIQGPSGAPITSVESWLGVAPPRVQTDVRVQLFELLEIVRHTTYLPKPVSR
jgi:hypothetical protein